MMLNNITQNQSCVFGLRVSITFPCTVHVFIIYQVKSRRQHREHHRSILLRAQVAEKESRLAAERRVKSEQEALKAKQRQEEALVRLEMVKIRKQLKEKQERER